MDYRKKIIKEKQVMKKWQDIKLYKTEITSLLAGKLHTEEDRILFLQCMTIVIEQLNIYEDDIKNSFIKDICHTNLLLEKNLKDMLESINVSFGKKKEVIRDMFNYLTFMDESKSIKDRLESLSNVRMSAWKYLLDSKDAIFDLLSRYPYDVTEEDFIIIFKCMNIIVLELCLKDHEVTILEKMKFI